ncbi:hypothetical protein IRZ83_01795 [Flavobacterium sp. JLP]|uniref:hypothetical protein n=1 Tax=unclassified Flavobacterium TaxID=196869 RepID=UPI000492F8DA|nr:MULTISPECIES: hypothetical protein [unclassified Flavobacterium]MBF4491266.1 hypothetical protein [Flavobacterium sp. MR2016-29]MBF4505379.1 hypothetical protein [Flavobacterium sp. JLP]
MEKVHIERLKKTLEYLESKQRELRRETEKDTRSIESMIKFLKKDMIEQFKLFEYNLYIKQEIKNTDNFISSVRDIIDEQS